MVSHPFLSSAAFLASLKSDTLSAIATDVPSARVIAKIILCIPYTSVSIKEPATHQPVDRVAGGIARQHRCTACEIVATKWRKLNLEDLWHIPRCDETTPRRPVELSGKTTLVPAGRFDRHAVMVVLATL